MAFVVFPNGTLYEAERWGLHIEAIEDLPDRLRGMWSRFRHLFRVQSGRDTSKYAFVYLRALLTMDRKRNYAEIARRLISIGDDGQNLQQFMSDSPWEVGPVFKQIQNEIRQIPKMHGGALTLDESGNRRCGENTVGSSRQYIGNIGKVDTGQVGVILGYYQSSIWTMVDAQLYLPEIWFDQGHEELCKRLHVPSDQVFETKPQIGLQMVKNAKEHGFPFESVLCDCVYGCDSEFRTGLDDENILYMADIRGHTSVYLNSPTVGIPQTPLGRQGRPFSKPRVLSNDSPVEPRSLVREMQLLSVNVRQTERGLLTFKCAARRVWTITKDAQVRQEWLFVKQEADGKFKFSLSNAPETTSLTQLAQLRSQRYFVERTIEDAKSELGWDELQARKHRAWMHHAALVALALWFAAEVKIDWAQQYPRDQELAKQLQLEVLPALSTANIREMLKSVLPLPKLSTTQVRCVVVKHLVARSRSTSCRLKQQQTIPLFTQGP